ncbi:MAG: hypothetical protein ABFC77_15825, partial [Thermoguttaceae bacterium]
AAADPIALGFLPFLVYPWHDGLHLSWAGPNGYAKWGRMEIVPTSIQPENPLLRLDRSNIRNGVHPRMF